uniref:Uncharacterized protein n=1 Tax=Lepeophtheirus salmonis TaxID=72036 RepID=A0A0K2VIV7_LEPSM
MKTLANKKIAGTRLSKETLEILKYYLYFMPVSNLVIDAHVH